MNPFGPLFPFELTRVVRRQRPILGRTLYVTALLILLGFVYLSLFPHGPASFSDFLFGTNVVKVDQMAAFGALFFSFFMVLQFSIGVFTAAGSTSSILAEEKEKHTLPFLLTTTMTDREIVFGKAGARLAQIIMVLLAALPVLAIMQVMGGIDPGLLLAAFVATGAALLSSTAIGTAVSITASTVKQANSRAIGIVVAYLGLGPMVGSYLMAMAGRGVSGATVVEIVDNVNVGNFYWVAGRIANAIDKGAKLDDVLWPALFRYLIFHGIVTLFFGSWAALRLRRILARQADQAIRKATNSASKIVVRGGRRPVSQTRPVLWREVCTAVGRGKQKKIAVFFKRLLFVLSFAPLVIVILENFDRDIYRVAEGIHILNLTWGTGVLMAALISIIATAAGSMGRERRQQTQDELYLTDLTNREILNQKALAALWSARWYLVWVAVHWTADLIAGGMSYYALLTMPPFFVLYAFLAVRIGMAFAVRETQKHKPGGMAVLTFLAICGLPVLIILFHISIIGVNDYLVYSAIVAAGLSPPAVLVFASVGRGQFNFLSNDLPPRLVLVWAIAVAIGVLECLLVAWWARRATLKRFAALRRE